MPLDRMWTEWQGWQQVVRDFDAIDIDVNDERAAVLISSIVCWGELLADLRLHQSPDVRDDAFTAANRRRRVALRKEQEHAAESG